MSTNNDPYEVLNLPPASLGGTSCTPDQVRTNYKLLARQLHPDKRPGNVSQDDATYMFQVLTDAYKRVMADIELRRADRTHLELKNMSRDGDGRGGDKRGGDGRGGDGRGGDGRGGDGRGGDGRGGDGRGGDGRGDDGGQKFNIAKFNSVFEEVRPTITDDRGYRQWMDTAPATQTHAEAVEQARLRKQGALQRYRDPDPMPLTGRQRTTAYSELGVSRTRDYSGRAGEVDFSDYKIAHTTTRLADQAAKVKADAQMRSFDAIKQARENANFDMTDEELHIEVRRKMDKERAELRRKQVLERQDRIISDVYDRSSRLLLG